MRTGERHWAQSHAEHYAALHGLLENWSELWGHSLFHRFAEMERLVPESWFKFGATSSLTDQLAITHGHFAQNCPSSLTELARSIHELCALPQASESRALSSQFARGLTPKKKHEIETVLGFFAGLGGSVSSILDIGGGAGHLARHLAQGLGCPVETIDRDAVVQAKGRRILRKRPWRAGLKHPVHFVTAEFSSVDTKPPIKAGSWSVGLHTCGDMAWVHLELAQKGYSVLNIGCCYEKLDPSGGTQRSRLARQRPLAWSEEALFLANRSGLKRPLQGFVFQQRVQRYRFSLHELLSREGCDRAQCEAVGSASASVYSGPFSAYVRDRLRHLGKLPRPLARLSDTAFEDFYRSIEQSIERKRFTAFVRSLFARPLEVALLLDRALFVEEGLAARPSQVRLLQLFDPEISPRNIGLVSRLRD